ncbi:hypothetical protein DFAR_2500027 [Desulfarculales bacterium]
MIIFLSNNIALTRKTVTFLKLENTWGALAMPTAVSSAKQAKSFTPSAEISGSRWRISRFRDKPPAGNWSLSLYPRPAGSAGTRPAEAALVQTALGGEAVNANISVVYAPVLDLPALSLCFREGHITPHFLVGCVVESLALSRETKGVLRRRGQGQVQDGPARQQRGDRQRLHHHRDPSDRREGQAFRRRSLC